MHNTFLRALQALRRAVQRLRQSPDDAYLAAATDLADLDRRVQHLTRTSASEAGAQLSFMARARG